MPQQKTPQLKTLTRAIETIDAVINEGFEFAALNGEEKIEFVIEESTLVAWRDALEWTHTFLLNRRDYHKRRNTTRKVEIELLEARLREAGVDVERVKREAQNAGNDALLTNEDEDEDEDAS